ncbi:MBL fold metallo-hydrolase [Clostridium sp.]|jgi:hydroxyacylglutathione hydrolase|uniref:MBL fold metallo-hydrolase n=1 Tax=Clostridium sp. TaxID=1506 RepID=UPI003A5BCED8
MKIKRMPVGVYYANCYILLDEEKMECAVIDPGGNADTIKSALKDLNVENVKFILLTHGHADHTGAAREIKKSYNAPIYISEKDCDMMRRGAYMYGDIHDIVDNFLVDNEELDLGKLKIKVINTPGHTPGGVCFLVNGVVFTGDTLFNGSIGRTDFEGGDQKTLIESIKTRLMSLSNCTIVLPGHEERTSIEKERITNPYL